MKLLPSILFPLFVLGAVTVRLPIPEGNGDVTDALLEFRRSVNHDGTRPDASVISKRQSTPYWYETIKHQGISAFGPSGYEVFRNVKDYGAKGEY